jgi:hypothetical protein
MTGKRSVVSDACRIFARSPGQTLVSKSGLAALKASSARSSLSNASDSPSSTASRAALRCASSALLRSRNIAVFWSSNVGSATGRLMARGKPLASKGANIPMANMA